MQRVAILAFSSVVATLAVPPAFAQLSVARKGPVAVTVADLALFAGGSIANVPNATVDIYDDASGTWSTAALSLPRGELAATAVGNLALFAGGFLNGFTSSDVVDVFDAQSMSWRPTAKLSQARFGLAATTVGTKAFFAGGGTPGPANTTAASDVVDIYDSSIGPPSNPAAWSTVMLGPARARGYMVAATVGSQALFAGGLNTAGAAADVDIYDNATGLWSTATLWQARVLNLHASATLGTRAYFAGGYSGVLGGPQVASDVIDVYDAQTGSWSHMTLSVARATVAATTVGNSVFFGGGFTNGPVPSDVVEILDASTGSWSPTAKLSKARWDLSATTVASKALFAGGTAGPGMPSSIVDVFAEVWPSFCVAKTTSVCGPALLSSTGSPSASATGSFSISAAPVRGCRAGLLLYTNQPTVPGLAFGGPGDGLLCLAVQGLRRAGPIDSGGTSPANCDGVLSIDMNAFAQGSWAATGCNPAAGQNNPAAFLNVMGTEVHAQMWGRDSVATGQLLTNGLSYIVRP